MKFAYADPPYLGCAKKHYSDHPGHLVYETIEGHRALIVRLVAEYPDGWALSCNSRDLHELLPLVPRDCRIAAWVKPFAAFKVNVNPAYTWEPVIFRGGRRGDRSRLTVKDHLIESITLQKGVVGAKPRRFADWVLDLLGYEIGDTLDDLFPGSGVMATALACRQPVLEERL